ncbi:MAG: LysE family transporter [Paracoccaceae bacterium]|nr:LysE family transporter [Paracoccaceae bacterium]
MTVALLPVVTSGVLMGWSVAWPPGPINTEIARRCLARGFWAGFSLILGACSGDALWALLVALGVGLLFTGPTAQLFMGGLSIGLLAVLMVTFLRRAVQGWRGGEAQSDGPRFDSAKASYVLGATMALTSPWNVTFWLAAVGRPGMSDLGLPVLLLTVVAVIAGAAAWGLVWSATVVIAHRRVGAGGRWGAVLMNGGTALLMLWFIVEAVMKLSA